LCRDEVTTVLEEHCDTIEEEVCEAVAENVCSTSTEEVCHNNEIEVCDELPVHHGIHERSNSLEVNSDLFGAASKLVELESNGIAEPPLTCDPKDVECFQATQCLPVTNKVCFTTNEVTYEEKCEVGTETQRTCTRVPRFQPVEKCEDKVQQSCSIIPVCRNRVPGCGGQLAESLHNPIELHSSVSNQLARQQLSLALHQQQQHPAVAQQQQQLPFAQHQLAEHNVPARLPVPAGPQLRQPKSCRIEVVQECETVPRTNCDRLPKQSCHIVPRQQCTQVPVEKLEHVC